MSTYTVTWQIDIEAETPEEAAVQALAVQRDSLSTATVFEVFNANTGEITSVDLREVDE